ncbi:Carboxyesterase [Heracleum sosnowskyi]|uniref:Carboxyesterase n=1 Tax=Heracleum sosnowskyi TaxID=360622 RepID=A0AAD8M2B8_9APIA|nr:Carboxyesterase [Heracleum sosnowskyi]
MDSTDEILHVFPPLFRVFKDGRLERLSGNDTVPASVDQTTGVRSKDVTINANSGVSARLYVPKSIDTDQKLPLVVYFHGGAFVVDTAFSPLYHTHLNNLAAEANMVIVSVDYRRVPEHPLPIAYEDSWDAVQWIASHSSRNGQEPWINIYADFQSVFFGGDSAGANIAHNMAVRAGSDNPDGLIVSGIVLVHPFFWAKEAGVGQLIHPESRAFAEKLWLSVNPCSSGLDDPLISPDPRKFSLGCKRVIIFVADRELLKHWGLYYKELLEQIGWGGKVQVVETKDVDHIFHIYDPTTDKAKSLVKLVASFVNEDKTV